MPPQAPGGPPAQPRDDPQQGLCRTGPWLRRGVASAAPRGRRRCRALWGCRHAVAAALSAALAAAALRPPPQGGGSGEEARIPSLPIKNWDKFAGKAMQEAQELMDRNTLVLDAEKVLARALRRLHDAGPRAAGAAERLRTSEVFLDVQKRVRQYDSVRDTLAPTGFKLVWEREDAAMWIHAPPGETWFEYRLVSYIDAPLRHCLVPLHERDLIMKYQPVFAEPHQEIGARGPHYAVVRTLSKILAFYVEMVFELLRVSNHGYGFMIERAISDFNDTTRDLPERPWWAHRVDVDTKNLWLPEGGNRSGTFLVVICRAQVGVPVREEWLSYLLDTLSPGILKNIRGGAHLAGTKGSLWHDRLQRDADGFYRELEEVERAATRREPITMHTLPNEEIFDRPWMLEERRGEGSAGLPKKKRRRILPRLR